MATDNVLEIKNLHTYFYTDTATVLRANEIDVDVIVLAKAVVGVFDNFLKNQHLYFAALNYYYQHSFCYIELRDGDELWENRSFSAIQNIHSNVFWLLSLFYEEHRLFMLFGNHDIAKKDFHPFSDCCFHEGLRLNDCVTGQEL